VVEKMALGDRTTTSSRTEEFREFHGEEMFGV